MISLGQKLKMLKTCEKPFHNNDRVVLCKKPLEKTPNIRGMSSFENRPSCKGYSPCKGYSLWKMVTLGQKLKMRKTCEKLFHNNIRVVLCKKPLQKTPNIREMCYFENRPSCKGYSPCKCKGSSLWKMVSFGQKLKMPKTCEKPFHENIRVVLYKKPLRKNTKYSRNELF